MPPLLFLRALAFTLRPQQRHRRCPHATHQHDGRRPPDPDPMRRWRWRWRWHAPTTEPQQRAGNTLPFWFPCGGDARGGFRWGVPVCRCQQAAIASAIERKAPQKTQRLPGAHCPGWGGACFTQRRLFVARQAMSSAARTPARRASGTTPAAGARHFFVAETARSKPKQVPAMIWVSILQVSTVLAAVRVFLARGSRCGACLPPPRGLPCSAPIASLAPPPRNRG